MTSGKQSSSDELQSASRGPLLPVVLSAVLSAFVALGVTLYTLHRADEQTHRERLAVVYLPLSQAAGAMMTCTAQALCTPGQAEAAYRDWSKAQYVAISLGSEGVSDAAEGLDDTFITVRNDRVVDKPTRRAVRHRAAEQSVRLQGLIQAEVNE